MSHEPNPTAASDEGALPTIANSITADLISGFLVFLIALPLCLGIAKASGFPPLAGIFTAILGGLICPWISNSELTIKGPAAGMIAVVLGAVSAFGYTGDDPAADRAAVQAVCAIGVISGVIQILLGLFKAGKLGDFFPSAAVHGLLASIGVIIMSKQIHVLFGVKPAGPDPISLIGEIPRSIQHLNRDDATIGLVSLAIMFLMPAVKKRVPSLKKVPAQLIVLILAIPLGQYLQVANEPIYIAKEDKNVVSVKDVLVPLPDKLTDALATPNFSALQKKPTEALQWIVMFCMVGTLESLLSAKAVDVLDPWQRKTNYDRDILAVGIANTVSSSIGGLPMISEILRSSANKDNGGRTRSANFFHGVFLLLCVLTLAPLLKLIPLSALAAMLVFAGFRLASPKEFLHMYQIGADQFMVFAGTVLGVLIRNDLLEGIAIGVAIKFGLHLFNGVPLSGFFRPATHVEELGEDRVVMHVTRPAVFSNWLALKSRLDELKQYHEVLIDLSEARFVDHTTMERLETMKRDFKQAGRELKVTGLEKFRPFGNHPLAARRATT